MTHVPMDKIKKVLDAAANLDQWVKKPEKK